jgi:hypothetical protein
VTAKVVEQFQVVVVDDARNVAREPGVHRLRAHQRGGADGAQDDEQRT